VGYGDRPAISEALSRGTSARAKGVLSVAFGPDGKLLALGNADNTIVLRDVVAHQPLGSPLTRHTDGVWSIAFSLDGKTLAFGSA
jgi:WD40 repeat protein